MTSSLIRNILKNRTATLTASLVLFSLSRYSSGCKDLKIHPEDAKLVKNYFRNNKAKPILFDLKSKFRPIRNNLLMKSLKSV